MTDYSLTHEDITKQIQYNPVTGIFTRIRDGRCAGTVNGQGYIQIMVLGNLYQAHRLAWICHYGEWPDGHIDHINRCRHDNSIDNLRLATRSQNQWNRSKNSTSTSGYKGVSYVKKRDKWRARIQSAGKLINLGDYATPEEAHFAYVSASKKLCQDFHRAV